MGKYILGLHAGHNASACIGDESGLIFAVQEERLNQEKNYWGFPREAIAHCLKHVGATPADLGSIAYGGRQVFCRYHSRDDVLLAYKRQSSTLGKLRQRLAVPLLIALVPDLGQDSLIRHLHEAGLDSIPRRHYDHHLTHAASAYYGLRRNTNDKYLVLTCDGSGDGLCATVRIMGPNEDRLLASTPWDNSLGALYSWTTFLLGFVPLEHEYKLMGMAPYASPRAAEEMAQVFGAYLDLDTSGLSFERATLRRTNDLKDSLLADFQEQRFDYICAGLQLFTENLLCRWTSNAVQAAGEPKVLAAGGVFMNVKANKRIGELPGVHDFEAFPSCGDETLSIGAFYLSAAQRWGHEAVKPLKDFYLGDDLDGQQTAATVEQSQFPYQRPADMAGAVSQVLAQGHPVARCAGRMEFGARALGNRSILADPRNLDVVRIINQMVKKRDFWMPFAPMVIDECQHEYLQNPKHLRSPFMMMTFDHAGDHRHMIAALHNADLTCRPQILTREQNADMYAILQAFRQRSGQGVVLNTSFNLHGFPIVRTAADALHVFKNSGLTYLQVGDYLVRKPAETLPSTSN